MLKRPNTTIEPGPILAAINLACAEHRITPSGFGRRAVKDPRLVSDLRDGKGIRPSRVARIHAFIATLGRA